MIADHLVNPFNIDPKFDLAHEPSDEKNWTEYRYFFAYDPDQEIGISLHIGRLVDDLSVWRGILYVFLPGGEILARKYSGPNGHPRGFGAGPLVGTCIEPMKLWTLEFHGPLQSVRREFLVHNVLRDGVDEVVSFHIVLEAAAPFFTLSSDVMKGISYAHHHFEQIHKIRGEITLRGKTIPLSGVGARDHSSGARDSSSATGSFWANMLFPSGMAVNVNAVRTKSFVMDSGYIFWGDGSPIEIIRASQRPALCDGDTPAGSVEADIMGSERKHTLVLETSRGQQVIEVERVNSVASTYIPPNHEVAGTDMGRPDSAQQHKAAVHLSWNGERGAGQLERYARIFMLKR